MKILNALGFFLFCFSVGAADVDPAAILLSAYSSQCPQVVTRDVRVSLSQIQELYATIETLKNDVNCEGANEMSQLATSYQSLYENYLSESDAKRQKDALEKKIAYYSTSITSGTLSPSTLSYLETQIVDAQSQLVSINSDMTRFSGLSGREAQGANQLVNSVNNFFSLINAPSNSACFEKHGAKISSLLSNVLMTSAAFASPGTALSLAAGSTIVSSLGTYIGNFNYNTSLDKLISAEMPTAMRCVSQVLTDQYCQVASTKEIINERVLNSNQSPNKFEGLNLLANQLGSLSTWLLEVYSGSQINSEGDLVNRRKPIKQYEFLQDVNRYIETYGSIKANAFKNISNEQDRSNAIAIAIEGMAKIMDKPSLSPTTSSSFGMSSSSLDVENPIWTNNSKDLMIYEIWSPGSVKSPPDGCGGDFSPCSLVKYLSKNNIMLNFQNWDQAVMNAKNIVQKTMKIVSADLDKNISSDGYTVLVDSKRIYKGQTNAYKGLVQINSNADRILTYLRDHGCENKNASCADEDNTYFPQMYNIQKTKNLTTILINLINEGLLPRTLPDDVLPPECRVSKTNMSRLSFTNDSDAKSFVILSCLSTVLQLRERGNDVYFRKVRDMVSYEMELRLLLKDFKGGVEDIIFSTQNDLVQALLASFGTESGGVSIDNYFLGLEDAQRLSKEALKSFFDLFKDQVIIMIRDDSMNRRLRDDMCFRVLPYVEYASSADLKSIFSYCRNAEMNMYKNGPHIKFSDYVTLEEGRWTWGAKLVSGKSTDARFCDYSDYHAQNILIDEELKAKKIENLK